MRLNNGATSAALSHGPGGQFGEENKWLKYINTTGQDHFIPDNSTAEKNSSFASAPVTKRKGDYSNGGYVYNNTAGFGTGPCWYGGSGLAGYTTPGGCPSGFSDAGTLNGDNGNNNSYNTNGASPHGNAFHMGWYVLKYGCPAGTYHKITIRYCRV
jgi:hypothetical protein